MKEGEKLAIIGCGGAGGPAAMLFRKLMPDIDITLIRAGQQSDGGELRLTASALTCSFVSRESAQLGRYRRR